MHFGSQSYKDSDITEKLSGFYDRENYYVNSKYHIWVRKYNYNYLDSA